MLIMLAPTVVTVAITVRAAGQGGEYLPWAVFASLVIAGITTALQGMRIGRMGGGHLLMTGVTLSFIPVMVLALDKGGPAMLASLTVLSGLFYLAAARWLPLVRRIITPVVSGTVLMLIGAYILPIAFDRLQEAPAGAPSAAGPGAAAVTLVVTAMLALRAPQAWRSWSPLFGIVAGCAFAAPFGLFDFGSLSETPWAGIPRGGFPGLDLTPGVEFWVLLPMFLVVTLALIIENISDGVAVQQVSARRPRATDFRLIQGLIYANGVGILLSGLGGTLPTTPYSSFSVSIINLTGVAARSLGYVIGAAILALAFFPKLTGVLLVMPAPIMGGFLLITVAMLFVQGVHALNRVGLDAQRALVAALAFALGLGMGHRNVVADLLGSPWGDLLGNGIMVGAVAAIMLVVFLEVTGSKRRRLRVRLDSSALPRIDRFLRDLAAEMGWSDGSASRLRSAGEETLLSLLQPENRHLAAGTPPLIINARSEGGAAELEFLAVFDEENLEDRLTYLEEQPQVVDERELSFRMLRHYASSVRHQKFHGLDVVMVRVDS